MHVNIIKLSMDHPANPPNWELGVYATSKCSNAPMNEMDHNEFIANKLEVSNYCVKKRKKANQNH